MTLLQKDEQRRAAERERKRQSIRARLRSALQEILPGKRAIVFGSLIRPGEFTDASDVDVALLEMPTDRSHFGIISELEERLHRSVDLIMLDESRFKEKIQREGELWTS